MVAATTRARTLVGVGTVLRFLVASWLIVGAVFTGSAVAHAHADLSFSTPEDGAALDVAPAEVRLTFNEELFAELVEISVLDANGDLVMATEAEQTPPPGTDVIVPWPADLPPGEYSVAYRVVSEDGHPVTGTITFSYTSVAQVEVVESPSPSAEPTQSAAEPTPEIISENATEEASQTPAFTSEEVATPGEPDSSLIGPLLIGAAIIVGIGVVFSIVMLARSRR